MIWKHSKNDNSITSLEMWLYAPATKRSVLPMDSFGSQVKFSQFSDLFQRKKSAHYTRVNMVDLNSSSTGLSSTHITTSSQLAWYFNW